MSRITIITCPFGGVPPVAIGAVEKLFYQLAGEWARNGHDVCFVCAGGGDDSRMRFVRLKTYKRTGSTKKDLFWDFLYSVKALWKCPKTDVLVCNTFWTPVFAPLFRWKYKRLVYGVHRYPKGQFWLYMFVHSFMCVSTCVGNALRSELNKYGLLWRSKKVEVIVNPIDGEIFHKLSGPLCTEGIVVYAGRVHPAKGILVLANACNVLYAEGLCRKLLLIGPWESNKGGGGESFVKQIECAVGNCPVELSGAIYEPAKLAELERSASLFVYPSEDEFGEACPVAPLEAMSIGLPTIVSDLRCYDDYAHAGVNSERFIKGNCDDLVSKMRRILTHPDEARSLGAVASETAKQFYIPHVAKKYEKKFEEVLSS